MLVSFNPTIANRTQLNIKSQNPTFGAVNTELLKECQKDYGEALNGALNVFHMMNKNVPAKMQDLKDTMEEAWKLGYIFGENGKKIWRKWIDLNVNPLLPKK